MDTARLYSLPRVPPPVYVSGFGEKSARLAARIADGYICMGPQADLIKLYRDEGGAGRPVQGGIKGCWAPDAGDARATMRRLWPNDSIPGESAQLLPLPRHFGQLAELVTEDMVTAPCGPDPEPYVKAIRKPASMRCTSARSAAGWKEHSSSSPPGCCRGCAKAEIRRSMPTTCFLRLGARGGQRLRAATTVGRRLCPGHHSHGLVRQFLHLHQVQLFRHR